MEAKSQSRRQRQGVNFNDLFFSSKRLDRFMYKSNLWIYKTVLLFGKICLLKLIQGEEQRGRGHDARRRPRAHRRREHGFEPVLLLSLRLQHLQQVRRNDRNRRQLERQCHGFDSGSSNVEWSLKNVSDCRKRRRRKRRR